MQSIDMLSEDVTEICGTVVEENGKVFFNFEGEKIDITEDLADKKESGTIEVSGKEYHYEITEKDGAYNINVNAEK